MLAKVRIAPVDRWCERRRARREYHVFAGMEIEIVASKSRIQKSDEDTNRHGYDCRIWQLPESTIKQMEIALGRKMKFSCLPDGVPAICEHMLEMD
jgi:hypothetical protein